MFIDQLGSINLTDFHYFSSSHDALADDLERETGNEGKIKCLRV